MTTNMNSAQVRVIDPILSNVALGYRQPQHVGMKLFPRVPVTVSGGQVLEFGKESFKKYNARRVPGASTKRVSFGYQGKPFALVQDSLEGVVPREHMRDAQAVPGINLGTRAVNNVMNILSLTLERDQAEMARNASLYDSDHKIDLASAKWTVDANNPSADIETGKEAIRSSIGMYPNTALLSAKAFSAAKNNAKILERFKYTSKDSITAEMLAALWDLDEVVVGGSVTASESGGFTDVWGSDVVLAYTDLSGVGMEAPSYGYTYTMESHPMTEEAYYDRNQKSWIYPVTYERAPVLSGITAGYLLQNVK